MAGDTWDLGDTGADISGGYEFESVGSTVPKTYDPNAQTRASDGTHSGSRIAVTFKGIKANYFVQSNGAKGSLIFLPLYAVVDGTFSGVDQNFGRVGGVAASSAMMRKFVGALVEASYEPSGSIISFRGKLASADYDRDKGFWDWKALDAEVALKKSYPLEDGSTAFDIELSLGASFGGVYMNGLSDIEKALSIAPDSNLALTINPLAMFRTGFHGSDWKVELVASGEQRFDLTQNKPSYLGRGVDASSQHATAMIEGEYVFLKSQNTARMYSLSAFANVGYEYDNLTLSHMFFGTNDAFNSFRLMGGLRGKF